MTRFRLPPVCLSELQAWTLILFYPLCFCLHYSPHNHILYISEITLNASRISSFLPISKLCIKLYALVLGCDGYVYIQRVCLCIKPQVPKHTDNLLILGYSCYNVTSLADSTSQPCRLAWAAGIFLSESYSCEVEVSGWPTVTNFPLRCFVGRSCPHSLICLRTRTMSSSIFTQIIRSRKSCLFHRYLFSAWSVHRRGNIFIP